MFFEPIHSQAAENYKLHELRELRRQKAAKKRRTSASEEERDTGRVSASKPSATSSLSESEQEEKSKMSNNHAKQTTSVSQRVFPSDVSDSSASSHSAPRRPLRRNRLVPFHCNSALDCFFTYASRTFYYCFNFEGLSLTLHLVNLFRNFTDGLGNVISLGMTWKVLPFAFKFLRVFFHWATVNAE